MSQELATLDDQVTMLTTPEDLTNALANMEMPELPDKQRMESDGMFSRRPYITLVQGGSALSTPPFEFRPGSFAITRNKVDVEDLGKEFDAYVCHWRHTAMANDKKARRFELYHDPDSEQFAQIREYAKRRVTGYMFGYEFLLYLPSTGEFVTFFCNSPTLQRCAREQLVNFIHATCTIKQDLITDNDKIPPQKWWGIKVVECSTPFAHPVDAGTVRATTKDFADEEDVIQAAAPVAAETTVETDRAR